MTETQRAGAGVRITGEHYSVCLRPVPEYAPLPGAPSIHVAVTALPALTDFDRPVDLMDTDPGDYAFTDIQLDALELRCLRSGPRTAAFRHGFVLRLEAGMAKALAVALPKIDAVSLHTAMTRDHLHVQLKRPLQPLERETLAEVVAGCLLDGQTLADAMAGVYLDGGARAFSVDAGDHDSVRSLGAALRSPYLAALLANAARDLSGGAL